MQVGQDQIDRTVILATMEQLVEGACMFIIRLGKYTFQKPLQTFPE
jgi:hypothetical protein